MDRLKGLLSDAIPALVEERRALAKEHGDTVVGEITVAQLLGGLRGVKGLVTDTSVLDPHEGIRFRGRTIPEIRRSLPCWPGGREPLPEGIFFLLLTGETPTPEDVAELTAAWRSRETLPPHVLKTIDALPKETHPMTQLVVGVAAMQPESLMARAWREGTHRRDLWEPALEDAMNLIARLPVLAAHIYARSCRDGAAVAEPDGSLDWAGAFACRLGIPEPAFAELLRMYLCILSDHEGGNVSAHTVHLVGSALADPYLAMASGLAGLAGPLHGLASQEALRWIRELQDELGGGVPRTESIEAYVWATLEKGQVVPGFGHAVLRATDPRYVAQREFALSHMPDDELFQIVDRLYEIVPRVLESHGKAKNPWPNVDAHTGCLLVHYGMTEFDFFTVLFGCSRALGTMASYVLDRAVGHPIERPKSVSTAWVTEQVAAVPAGR